MQGSRTTCQLASIFCVLRAVCARDAAIAVKFFRFTRDCSDPCVSHVNRPIIQAANENSVFWTAPVRVPLILCIYSSKIEFSSLFPLLFFWPEVSCVPIADGFQESRTQAPRKYPPRWSGLIIRAAKICQTSSV